MTQDSIATDGLTVAKVVMAGVFLYVLFYGALAFTAMAALLWFVWTVAGLL